MSSLIFLTRRSSADSISLFIAESLSSTFDSTSRMAGNTSSNFADIEVPSPVDMLETASKFGYEENDANDEEKIRNFQVADDAVLA